MPRPGTLTEDRRSEILRYITTQTPDIVNLYEGGWDSVVGITGDRVFRFPRGKWATERVRREVAFLHAFASQSPVPVPDPTLIANPVHMVYPLVPGEPLKPALLAEWSHQQRAEAAATLGDFLSILHGFPVNQASAVGLKPDAWAESWWEQDDEEFRRRVLPLLGTRGRRLAESTMEKAHPEAMSPPRKAVVHNDLGPDHILTDGKAITGIIDFGDAAIGDPALDFQWSILYRQGGTHYENEFVDAVLEGYRHVIDEAFVDRVKAYRIYHGLRDIRDEHALGTRESLAEAVTLFEQAAERLLS